MVNNPVGWFEIYVQDMPRARAFYEAVFGIKLEHLKNPDIELWGFPMASGQPGASGALVRMEGKSSGGGGTLVYFSCQDCAVEASRVVANGGTIHRDRFPIGEYGFIALVTDPDGNMFGLHSQH
jgi:uncharacterized protein